MNLRFFFLIATSLIMTSCASATPSSPTADVLSTVVHQTVFAPLTLTASAPTATMTSTPAPTLTPLPTNSPAPTPTFAPPTVTANASCWSAPGDKRLLITHVEASQTVELLGVGSVPGWYVIRSPHFNHLCWLEASYLKLDPRLDTSKYRVMKPGENFSELP